MREYTEIVLSNSIWSFKEFLHDEKIVYLKFDDSDWWKMAAAYPIEIVDDETLKFKTEGICMSVPLKKGNLGTTMEIFKDHKNTQKIADGTVKSKYFEPSTRSSFNNMIEIDTNNCDKLDVNIELTKTDKEVLELGMRSYSMDDKWFSFVENDEIHLFRSWTGAQIFLARIEFNKENLWTIREVSASREWKTSNEHKIAYFKDNTIGHINYLKSKIL